MMEIVFVNEETNLQYAFPIEENLISILRGQIKPSIDINPKIVDYVKEWDELLNKLKIISDITKDDLDLTIKLFLQVISFSDRKGAIILNKKYPNKEKFIKTLRNYFKNFLIRKLREKYEIPPDILITALAYIHFSKYEQLSIDLPTKYLGTFLNIINSEEDVDKELKELAEKENKLRT